MNKTGIIYGVNGPVIYLKGDPGFKISEMVYVGPEKLVSFITFSTVSSVLWRRSQNPPENIFPVV